MPDTDIDKSRTSPPGQRAGKDAARKVPRSIDEELDQLLAEIEVAVDELDPTGDLEQAAAEARTAAVTGDPEYDEIEDLFEVIEPSRPDEGPGESESAATGSAGPATAEPEADATHEAQAVDSPDAPSDLDAELDELMEVVEPPAQPPASEPPAAKASAPAPLSDRGSVEPDHKAEFSVEHSQIDNELDALLAEAGSALDEGAAGPGDAAERDGAQPSGVAPAATDAQEGDDAPEPIGGVEAEEPASESAVKETGATEPEAQPESAEPAPGAGERSIEEVDADLAARADVVAQEEATDEQPEPADDASADVFQSGDDVVEQVIDEHASAVQSDGTTGGDADGLAQLMADSPASASVGVDTSGAAAPQPAAPAAEEKAADHEGTAPAELSPAGPASEAHPAQGAPTLLQRVARRIRPPAVRIARMLSKPMELVPVRVRDDIAWVSIVTMFFAITLWIGLALFR